MATREYTNQNQSGTVYKSPTGGSPTDQLTDRVMMIAHRVVDLEKKVDLILEQVAKLGKADAELKTKIEEIQTESSSLVQEATAPKPRAARRRKPKATATTETTTEETTN